MPLMAKLMMEKIIIDERVINLQLLGKNNS